MAGQVSQIAFIYLIFSHKLHELTRIIFDLIGFRSIIHPVLIMDGHVAMERRGEA